MIGSSLLLAAALVIAPAGHGKVDVRFQDARITEASGIAVGVRSPGVVYAQNDSGDTARVFAVDAATGATAAVVTVPGVPAHDWEDIATAPDAAGTPSLWIADIGDNDATRAEVEVYRVDEPHVAANGHDRAVRTGTPDVWRARYPGGAADAESLAVTPGGVPYVITKSIYGRSVVYRLPREPDAAAVRAATRVATIAFDASDSPNPFGTIGTLTATGAAVSPDGRLLAVRTYADAWIWRIGAGGVTAALTTAPARVRLPGQRQGEGIAFDGARLLIDSEGVHSRVETVALPASLTAAAAPSAGPTVQPSTSAGSTRSTEPSPSRGPGGHGHAPAAFVALAFIAIVLWVKRWNRRRLQGRGIR